MTIKNRLKSSRLPNYAARLFLTQEAKRIDLPVKGFCMFPGLLPIDRVTVEFMAIDAIVPGDIAVFRSGGEIYAHRAIRTGFDRNGRYIVTLPDNGPQARELTIYNDGLIGAVKSITRFGYPVKTKAKKNAFWKCWAYCIRMIYRARKSCGARLDRSLGVFREHMKISAYDFTIEIPLDIRQYGIYSLTFPYSEALSFLKSLEAEEEISQWIVKTRFGLNKRTYICTKSGPGSIVLDGIDANDPDSLLRPLFYALDDLCSVLRIPLIFVIISNNDPNLRRMLKNLGFHPADREYKDDPSKRCGIGNTCSLGRAVALKKE